MKSSRSIIPGKIVVAVHEAGHLAAVMASPYRTYISNANLMKRDERWEGNCVLDRSTLHQQDHRRMDPYGYWDFAVSIAGPLAQWRCFPDSFPDGLAASIQKDGSLLKAVRNEVLSPTGIEVQWLKDLGPWINAVKWCKMLSAVGLENSREELLLQVEVSLQVFLNHPESAAMLLQFADQLDSEGRLTRNQILKVPTDTLPPLRMPSLS